MLVCPVLTHCIKLWCNISIYSCLFSDKSNTCKFTKEVLINKHQIKAAYFKPMQLWRCSQNQWRHCKIILFCMNTLDLWHPWTLQRYVSTVKFYEGELKYKDLLYLQRNSNGSHICTCTYYELLVKGFWHHLSRPKQCRPL